MSDTSETTTGIAAALAAIVAAFVWLVRRGKNGDAHPPGPVEEPLSDRISRAVALIEHEDIDLPKNWREFIDRRIEHKLNNRRAVLFAIVGLLERGQHERALTLLREEAEDLKQ
jgi:uncharacterized protein (TIGR03382 family)